MKRKEFYWLTQPLLDRLYRFSYALIPDDLQAEQLVIDAVNVYLLKEKKTILTKDFDSKDKKAVGALRRSVLKGLLRYICEIGVRRSLQVVDPVRPAVPSEFKTFYSLDPKVRMVIALRYDHQFAVDDIEAIAQMPRFEIIEKLHNGRFLLNADLIQGLSV